MFSGNTAAGYGAGVVPADVFEGERYWKAVQVRHLLPAENGRRHHVYVDVVDEDGQRVRNGALAPLILHRRIAWDWNGRRPDEVADPKPLDKPDGEPAGNVPMGLGQVVQVSIKGDGLESDTVTGLHTNWPDEVGPDGKTGNTVGHHSYHVIFQRTVATMMTLPGQPAEPEKPTQPPTDNNDLSAQVGALQREVAALRRWQNTVTTWLRQLEGEL
ncbi:MAG: hypothetical protein AB7R40_22305 [Nitrospiraceae bacterium]